MAGNALISHILLQVGVHVRVQELTCVHAEQFDALGSPVASVLRIVAARFRRLVLRSCEWSWLQSRMLLPSGLSRSGS